VKAGPSAENVAAVADLLRAAKSPVILMGRVSRSVQAWRDRIALAERVNASVLVDHGVAAAFPTLHPLNKGATTFNPTDAHKTLVREADLILSLDWVDVGGLVHAACGGKPGAGKVVHVSLDHTVHNGWSMDHMVFPPVDLLVAAEPDLTVAALNKAMGAGGAPASPRKAADWTYRAGSEAPRIGDMVTALRTAIGERPSSLLSSTIAWNEDWWPLAHPLDWIGGSGGGGLGGGPGLSVGAALALRGSGRLPVCVTGDGDYLMGATAIWTAVRYRIPVLFVIANNRSFFNDELHQERVAKMRSRPAENRWIGQKMIDPEVDLAQMAESQGAVGIGPVERIGDMAAAFAEAIAATERGHVVVVDVRVVPGYA
jgi:thiamine pyrophosphate-dependent acetolactate synthase large subunit-like protein